MIGIKAIASYVPEQYVDNFEQAKKFGETKAFIENKIGAIRLPRKDNEQDTSDLAEKAVLNLFKQCPELIETKVDALVVITQNPDDEGIPHTSAILQRKLGLPTTVATFDVSLGCSGFVYGLYILKGFLETSGLKSGILVTCDPYSKIVDDNDRVTSMLFGDAATATWLSEEALWSLDAVSYGTDGFKADNLQVTNKQLYMNGRQIFNFAATQVEPHIRELLDRENIFPEDVDYFCLHQGSGAIVDAISRRFKGISERFIKDMTATGNTVSSSIPLLLEKLITKKNTKKILMSGFGVGLSVATAIISKIEKE
jgi:3-oxoacyl-[acyl-carrier-protein] synthase-3